ncbi:hypothetical protein HW555_006050 [Spodoptera exigua]|uniref:Uncharacterized protein n=1 Tax=Spodoptera exigua TaxID=7107 RepID=A0A835GFS5_SPOEX|nr:hypothetical protein HW555_006050 [Spodoptera exigua]
MKNTGYPTNHQKHSKSTTKCMSSAMKTVTSFSKDFCNETSMHGFIHIAAPRRHWFERLLWIVATALCVWGALDVALGQLQRYNESPTVVTMEKDFRSWEFNLPAQTLCFKADLLKELELKGSKQPRHEVLAFVAIPWIRGLGVYGWKIIHCEMNRVDNKKLPSVVKKYFGTDPSDDQYQFYVRLVKAIANSDILHLEGFQEFGDMETSVDMFGVAVDVMPDNVIKTKSSDGVAYTWIPVMTEAGVCHTTNCLAIADVAIGPLKSNATAGWPGSCAYASVSCFIITDITANGRFYVHSPYDLMDLSVDWTDIILTLVRATELSVMESRCGRGVKDLSPSRRGCSYMDEPRLSGRKVHSTNTCRLACRSKLARELCDCVPFYYFYDDGPTCTPKGMWCLAKNAQKLLKNDDRKCSCVPQCIDCNYKEMIIEEQVWKNPPFNQHGSIKYSVQPPQTRYTREIVFHFQDLVVSFGGAAGLFLGASFISLVEILYIMVARLFRHISGAEDHNSKAAAVTVKEVGVSHETLRINYLTAILEEHKDYDKKPSSYYY